MELEDKVDRLEEIRKRDELYNGQFTTIVYSDRRWLLGEIDAQREELGRLRAENADLRRAKELRDGIRNNAGV